MLKLVKPSHLGEDPAEAFELIASVLEASTGYSKSDKDLEGTTLLWNAGARRRHGSDPGEVPGGRTSILHTP